MRKLLEDAWSFFAMVMMLIGIGGLAFHMFKTDGWVTRLTGRAIDAGTAHPATAIPLGIAALALGWACLNGKLVVGKRQNTFGDLMVFALIFAGIYFTYVWLDATT
ncbi:MAG: hypothetical protein M0P39_11090 [Rhodocyclaceae bacterium]|jgi:hypothetical protein|nr:hypothetical protein [Rhodocyclaceae bacterium]